MKNIKYINGQINFSFDKQLDYDGLELPILPIGATVSTRFTQDVIVGIEYLGCGFRYKIQTIKVKPGPEFLTKNLFVGKISQTYAHQLTKIEKISV
jgi:hypothetical protein